jgi:hypothetical protein
VEYLLQGFETLWLLAQVIPASQQCPLTEPFYRFGDEVIRVKNVHIIVAEDEPSALFTVVAFRPPLGAPGVHAGTPRCPVACFDQAHFRRSRIARPITQSLSLSVRKLSSSVKWLMRWR